eukprot:scaffold263_cov120-Isochrysis_galbana.AAC.14
MLVVSGLCALLQPVRVGFVTDALVSRPVRRGPVPPCIRKARHQCSKLKEVERPRVNHVQFSTPTPTTTSSDSSDLTQMVVAIQQQQMHNNQADATLSACALRDSFLKFSLPLLYLPPTHSRGERPRG